MKQLVLTIFISMSLLLSACASSASPQTPVDTTAPVTSIPAPSETPEPTRKPAQPEVSPTTPPTYKPTDIPPAQQAAIQALADTLGIDPGQVKIVSAEGVDWPNGCLGVQQVGVMCTQQIVPGFRIILKANGQQYEYHTDRSGSQLVPAKDQQPIPVSNDAVQAAIQELASALAVPPDQVSLVSAEMIEWPDSCLGIQQTNIACAEIVTPGYLIVLELKGHQYEYHSDTDGTQAIPATLGLSWTRQGGIAGYCDELQIYLPNQANASTCNPPGSANSADLNELLSASEIDQFNQWLDEFGSVTLTQKDPAVTDAMTQTLLLQGFGQGQPDASQQQALFAWTQMVFGKMHP
jgi:hypothetical protein